jgi:hypothetical protein
MADALVLLIPHKRSYMASDYQKVIVGRNKSEGV